jgi:hypothetical protein
MSTEIASQQDFLRYAEKDGLFPLTVEYIRRLGDGATSVASWRQWSAVATAHDDLEPRGSGMFQHIVTNNLGEDGASDYAAYLGDVLTPSPEDEAKVGAILVHGGELVEPQSLDAFHATRIALIIGRHFAFEINAQHLHVENTTSAEEARVAPLRKEFAARFDKFCDYILRNAELGLALRTISRVEQRTNASALLVGDTPFYKSAYFVASRRHSAKSVEPVLFITEAAFKRIEPPGGVIDDSSDMDDPDALLIDVRRKLSLLPDPVGILAGHGFGIGTGLLPEGVADALVHALVSKLEDAHEDLYGFFNRAYPLRHTFRNSVEAKQFGWEFENAFRFVANHTSPDAHATYYRLLKRRDFDEHLSAFEAGREMILRHGQQ